jgi:hypothetical protein
MNNIQVDTATHMVPTVAIPQLNTTATQTIFTTAICIFYTAITWMITELRSARRIPKIARRLTTVPDTTGNTFTGSPAATKEYLTGITSIT